MPLGEGVPGGLGGAGGHGSESCSLSRLRSSSLEKGSEILREQLTAAQRELQLKGEECERLSRVRDQLEQELEELTASLFEEANKMVHEASRKQAAAEKQLREAQGKIDVLQAEVSALKTLVLTSTPASPNPQLHPQLLPPARGGAPRRGGGHVRNKSAGTPAPPPAPLQPMGKEDRESAAPALLSLIVCVLPGRAHSVTYEPRWPAKGEGPAPRLRQLDSVLYAEFLSWKEQPSLEQTSAFMNRVYREDIGPCLSFTRRELAEAVQAAVESNSLSVEPVALQTLPVVKASAVDRGGPNGCRGQVETRCALSGLCCPCTHRIRLGDSEVYYHISPSSRARITAVCNFFTYVRYIQQGLVRQDAAQVFWELMRLRREMSVAKLGVYWTEEG